MRRVGVTLIPSAKQGAAEWLECQDCLLRLEYSAESRPPATAGDLSPGYQQSRHWPLVDIARRCRLRSDQQRPARDAAPAPALPVSPSRCQYPDPDRPVVSRRRQFLRENIVPGQCPTRFCPMPLAQEDYQFRLHGTFCLSKLSTRNASAPITSIPTTTASTVKRLMPAPVVRKKPRIPPITSVPPIVGWRKLRRRIPHLNVERIRLLTLWLMPKYAATAANSNNTNNWSPGALTFRVVCHTSSTTPNTPKTLHRLARRRLSVSSQLHFVDQLTSKAPIVAAGTMHTSTTINQGSGGNGDTFPGASSC